MTGSDTLLPVRGRKHTMQFSIVFIFAVQIPYSPWGDGNDGKSPPTLSLAVQIPYSPWGDGNCHSFPCRLVSLRSDTLLPVRGRKLNELHAYTTYLILVQIPFSPSGDGNTNPFWTSKPASKSSDTLLPARGRKLVKTSNQFNDFLFRYLSPREGPNLHILSQRKKPTCNACGLLLLVEHVLAFFTRIFDLPPDG